MRTSQRGIQHQHPGRQREQEQELDGGDHLIDHGLNLPDHIADIDHGQVRKITRELVHQSLILRRQMERGNPCLRRIGHHRRVQDHEKIHLHRTPVELAQTGDRRFDHLPGDVEPEHVAQLQPERLGQTFLDRGFRFTVVEPASGNDLILRWQTDHRRQVELALDQPFGAVVDIFVAAFQLVINLDQPAANHRIQGWINDAVGRQLTADTLGLVGLDIDDKLVGRIGRRGLTPGTDQIAAHDGE